jgi:copper chaperone CopZ
MHFFRAIAVVTMVASATTLSAADPTEKNESPITKSTYLITGLHCPPCTKTVERSLQGVNGVKSVNVDWQSKNARIEFDEKLIPGQVLAQRIAATPHMMGSRMKYDGWLALKADGLRDEAIAKKTVDVLKGVKGVKQVTIYARQQSVGVQFDATGKLRTRDLIEALSGSDVKAANLWRSLCPSMPSIQCWPRATRKERPSTPT